MKTRSSKRKRDDSQTVDQDATGLTKVSTDGNDGAKTTIADGNDAIKATIKDDNHVVKETLTNSKSCTAGQMLIGTGCRQYSIGDTVLNILLDARFRSTGAMNSADHVYGTEKIVDVILGFDSHGGRRLHYGYSNPTNRVLTIDYCLPLIDTLVQLDFPLPVANIVGAYDDFSPSITRVDPVEPSAWPWRDIWTRHAFDDPGSRLLQSLPLKQLSICYDNMWYEVASTTTGQWLKDYVLIVLSPHDPWRDHESYRFHSRDRKCLVSKRNRLPTCWESTALILEEKTLGYGDDTQDALYEKQNASLKPHRFDQCRGKACASHKGGCVPLDRSSRAVYCEQCAEIERPWQSVTATSSLPQLAPSNENKQESTDGDTAQQLEGTLLEPADLELEANQWAALKRKIKCNPKAEFRQHPARFFDAIEQVYSLSKWTMPIAESSVSTSEFASFIETVFDLPPDSSLIRELQNRDHLWMPNFPKNKRCSYLRTLSLETDERPVLDSVLGYLFQGREPVYGERYKYDEDEQTQLRTYYKRLSRRYGNVGLFVARLDYFFAA